MNHPNRRKVLECGGKRSATPLSNPRRHPNRASHPIQKRCHPESIRDTPRREALKKDYSGSWLLCAIREYLKLFIK
jgi:hypothetical protein